MSRISVKVQTLTPCFLSLCLWSHLSQLLNQVKHLWLPINSDCSSSQIVVFIHSSRVESLCTLRLFFLFLAQSQFYFYLNFVIVIFHFDICRQGDLDPEDQPLLQLAEVHDGVRSSCLQCFLHHRCPVPARGLRVG